MIRTKRSYTYVLQEFYDAFWEFLYSDKWTRWTCLRVMEGQLLDDLLTNLHILIKQGGVVKHKTLAYARNQRENPKGCYNLANQKGCDSFQETRQIEFTYFAKRIDPRPPDQSKFTSYQESITTTISSNYGNRTRHETPQRHFSEDSNQTNTKTFTKSKRMSATDYLHTAPGPASRNYRPRNSVDINENKELDIFSHSYSQSTGALHAKATHPIVSDLQRKENVPYPNTCSNQMSQPSSGSNYKDNSPIQNLKKIQCSEKSVQEDDIICMDPSIRKNNRLSMSEGAHLGKNRVDNKETAWLKLQKRKQEKQKDNAEAKQAVEEWRTRKLSSGFLSVPTSSPECSSLHVQYRFLDYVPTFEEFLLILDKDKKYESTFKREKLFRRKVTKCSNDAKKKNQGQLAVQKTQRKPKKVSKLPPIMKKPRQISTANRVLRESNKEQKSKCQSKILLETKLVAKESLDPVRMAKEVGVVTGSHLCEKHVQDNVDRKRDSRRNSRKESKGFSGNKYAHALDESEYEETSSESDDVCSDSDELFDTRKLNTKNSFERLRGTNCSTEKTDLYSVYREHTIVQKVVKSFQENTKKKNKSGFPPEESVSSKTEKIGKLKHYNFLLHPRRIKVKIDPQTFESYSMVDFRKSLLGALDDFVVRKECFISDIGAKSSTTITFTKKFVFTNRGE